jgi:hypothetical protein
MGIKDINGLPVLDAKRPLKLSITIADITGANPKIPNNCAVARACYRQLHVKEARVHLSRIYLRTNDKNWVRYMTPPAVRDEIIAFDRGAAFHPLEVKLAGVHPSHRTGGRAQGGKNKKGKKPGKPRSAAHVVTGVRAGPA